EVGPDWVPADQVQEADGDQHLVDGLADVEERRAPVAVDQLVEDDAQPRREDGQHRREHHRAGQQRRGPQVAGAGGTDTELQVAAERHHRADDRGQRQIFAPAQRSVERHDRHARERADEDDKLVDPRGVNRTVLQRRRGGRWRSQAAIKFNELGIARLKSIYGSEQSAMRDLRGRFTGSVRTWNATISGEMCKTCPVHRSYYQAAVRTGRKGPNNDTPAAPGRWDESGAEWTG